MQNNRGLVNEENFKNSINDKYYDDLDNNLKMLIKKSFVVLNLKERIKCERCEKGRKADIVIRQNNDIFYYSLKSGTAKTVHEEHLKTFIPFLLENNISKETIRTILLFQFGDGTTNGKGEVRMSYSEVFASLKNRIKLANLELNKNIDFVKKCFIRFVLDGYGNDMRKVDFIYHGSIEYGVLCSRKQLLSHIDHKSFNYMDNLHIGPLLIHPRCRYIDFKETDPESRYKISVKWPNMQADLAYISERYNFY